MKLKVGDRVRFLHEIGGGEVSRIIDHSNVMVKDDDGFEVPFHSEKLVKVDAPSQKTKDDIMESKMLRELRLKNRTNDSGNLILALIPNTATESRFVFLNETGYTIICLAAFVRNNRMYPFLNTEIDDACKDTSDCFRYEEMKKNETLIVQLIFYSEENKAILSPLDFRMSVKDLMEIPYRKNDFFENEAIILSIRPDEHQGRNAMQHLIDPAKLAAAMMEKGDQKKTIADVKKVSIPEMVEIDLHIYELTDKYTEMDNPQMLRLQMDTFEKELNKAILEKKKKIVFIHGVGNGTLKHELRRVLDRKYHDFSYQDASYAEYGYGATMVLLK